MRGMEEIKGKLYPHTFAQGDNIFKDMSELLSKQINKAQEAIDYAWEYTSGRCIFCGKKLYYQIDNSTNDYFFNNSDIVYTHLIPVAHGGLFIPGNIAFSCVNCTYGRGKLDYHDYYVKRIDSGQKTLYDFMVEDDFKSPILEIEQFMEPMDKYISSFFNQQANGDKLNFNSKVGKLIVLAKDYKFQDKKKIIQTFVNTIDWSEEYGNHI